MNELSRLKVLAQILEKKKEALNAILIICENGVVGRDSALEKQRLIDGVLKADAAFSTAFAPLKDNLADNAYAFKPEVKNLQRLIREVSGLDARIRLSEIRRKIRVTDCKRDRGLPRRTVAKLYGDQKRNNSTKFDK